MSTGRKQPKGMKTPSIKRFFSKVDQKPILKTGDLMGKHEPLGENNKGAVGLVGGDIYSAKQNRPEAKNIHDFTENIYYGGSRQTSKENIQQQLVVDQNIGRCTEIYRVGCVGQTRTGFERVTECTEQLRADRKDQELE